MITCTTLLDAGWHLYLSKLILCKYFSRSAILRVRTPPKLTFDRILESPTEKLAIDDELYNSLKGKVIYNCTAKKRNSIVRWHIRNQEVNIIKNAQSKPTVPLSLRYKYGDSVYEFDEYRAAVEDSSPKCDDELPPENTDEKVHLPYTAAKQVEFQSDTETKSDRIDENGEINITDRQRLKFEYGNQDVDPPQIGDKKWMSDYEVYEEIGVQDEAEISLPKDNYGTADPNILPTNIPCGGCGAHLHCQSSSIPGFLPKELFMKCTETDFHRMVCQRCSFLKHYNIALSVFVDPNMYSKLLASLKYKPCLIVLLIDMTDFPCSVWPNILEIIGNSKPIILVGNKIDLIPGDCPGWLQHAEKALKDNFVKGANVIGTCLISAKTGFGVEELITKLFTKWRRNGDVYLVGCTNVGKSSLFNALINSDYCKSKAVDLMQRATVSSWPGTTLNLLKFPIFRMEGWRSYLRTQRLIKERKTLQTERELEKMQCRADYQKYDRLPKIQSNVGRTFHYADPKKFFNVDNTKEFVMPKLTNKLLNKDDRTFLDPESKDFKTSNWCYDTPGVVHRDQIINLLTTEELNTLISDSIYYARIFSVYVNQTLFIGGLARLDLVESENKFLRFIIYSPSTLPITVCWTENADEVYDTLVGSKYMKVPRGSAKRLEKWPKLETIEDIEIKGEGFSMCTSEIVLSSAGWVSFSAKIDTKSKLRAWTPEARGIYLRKIPLLRYTNAQRRSRVPSTPTYYMSYLK